MGKSQRDSIHDARGHAVFVLDDDIIDRYAATIGAYGIAVYVALARFAKREGQTIMAYGTLVKVLGFGRTKIRATLKELADAGLIAIEPQTDTDGNPIASNRYILLPTAHQKHGGVSPHDTPVSRDDTPLSPHDRGVSRGEYIDNTISRSIESSSPSEPPKSDDDGDLFQELRKRGISRQKSKEIVATGADGPTVLTSIDNLHDPTDKYSMGRIIDRLIDAPPQPGKPYTRAAPKAGPAAPTWRPPSDALTPAQRAQKARELLPIGDEHAS